MRFLLLPLSLLLALLVACGDEDSSVTGPSPGTSADASNDTSPSSDAANSDAAGNDCTSRGYECHLNPTCNPEYMPLSTISCGATGGYCCIKGAMPPGDASTDG